MAFKASKIRKIRRQNIPRLEADAYVKIPVGDLILFSFRYVQEQGMPVALEDVVSAAFLLFPHRFALKHYPKWPDSALVSRRWADCKSKGLISTDIEAGFKLSSKGSRIAERVAKTLGLFKAVPKIAQPVGILKAPKPDSLLTPGKVKPKTVAPKAKPVKVIDQVVALLHLNIGPQKQKVNRKVETEKIRLNTPIGKTRPIWTEKSIPPAPMPPKHNVPVERSQPIKIEKVIASPTRVSKENKALAGKFVRVMEKSDAYGHYRKNGNKAHISEFDFRNLLLCTMETSPETLARNVNLYKSYATIHDRQDLISLLDYCENNFSYLMKKSTKSKRQV